MRPDYLQAIYTIFLSLIFSTWLSGVLLVVNAQEDGGEGMAAAEVQFPAGVNPAEDARAEVDLVHEKEKVQQVLESESETQVCAPSEGSSDICMHTTPALLHTQSIACPLFSERQEALETDDIVKWVSVGFIHAFVSSFSVIIVSEIGDKTFFIAAIMAMKHSR